MEMEGEDDHRLDQKAVVEFLGSFILTLTFGCSTLMNPSSSALATGTALVALSYGGSTISGANYNPAISLAFLVNGALTFTDAIVYWIAQFSGAVVAAFAVEIITGKLGVAATMSIGRVFPAFFAEFVFTFALVYVVLNVSVRREGVENHSYGLATGFMVLSGSLSVGSICLGSFNPAVTVAAGILGLGSVSTIWLPFLADCAGGLIAGLIHVYVGRHKIKGD